MTAFREGDIGCESPKHEQLNHLGRSGEGFST